MDDEMMDIVDDTPGDQLLALARLLQHPPAPPSTRRRRTVVVPIRASDAEAAGGEEIVHRTISAVASPDDRELHRKAASVIATLAAMKPVGPMESSLAGLFLAMQAAALDSLAVARIAGFDSLLGLTLLSRSEKLTCRAVELAQVIERRGGRGKTPNVGLSPARVIRFDHIRHG